MAASDPSPSTALPEGAFRLLDPPLFDPLEPSSFDGSRDSRVRSFFLFAALAKLQTNTGRCWAVTGGSRVKTSSRPPPRSRSPSLLALVSCPYRRVCFRTRVPCRCSGVESAWRLRLSSVAQLADSAASRAALVNFPDMVSSKQE